MPKSGRTSCLPRNSLGGEQRSIKISELVDLFHDQRQLFVVGTMHERFQERYLAKKVRWCGEKKSMKTSSATAGTAIILKLTMENSRAAFSPNAAMRTRPAATGNSRVREPRPCGPPEIS